MTIKQLINILSDYDDETIVRINCDGRLEAEQVSMLMNGDVVIEE